MIEVTRNTNGRSWSIAKSKDGADDVTTAFKLVVHELGNDSDGDPRTSCTVELDTGQIFQKPEPTGKAQKATLKIARQAIEASVITGKAGAGLTHCIKAEDLITAISNTLATTSKHKRNNRAKTIVNGLCDSNHLASGIENDEGWVWLP
jgi:hypothetical protein